MKGVGTARDLMHVARSAGLRATRLDLGGEAAKIAYYFFLSIFPLVLTLFALTGIVGGDAAFARITAIAEAAVPTYAWQFVHDLIREITHRDRPGLLSFGILLTLWVASNGISALITALNLIYRVREARPWWKRRLLSLLVLVAGIGLIVVGSTAVIPGVGLLTDGDLARAWRIVWRPLGLAVVTAGLWLAYHYLPAREQRGTKVETLAGAAVASLLWLLATEFFRSYLVNFSRYDLTYGTVGAVIVLLIWFYISAFVVLIGGLVAETVEARRRHGASIGAMESAA